MGFRRIANARATHANLATIIHVIARMLRGARLGELEAGIPMDCWERCLKVLRRRFAAELAAVWTGEQ